MLMSSSGEPMMMPESIEEKTNSAVRAMIRSVAEQNGHKAEVFNAMVDKDQGLTIDGVEIVPEGKLVTLTTEEAAKKYGNPPRPLLSAGTRESLEAMIESIAAKDAKITRVDPSGFEMAARLIVMLAPVLMGGALLFGYIEFKTPGFGIFGLMAILLFLLCFLGHYIAGLTGYGPLALFVLGLVMICVELFVFPGMMIAGTIGVFCMIAGLLLSMTDTWPTLPNQPLAPPIALPTYEALTLPMLKLAMGFAISLLGIWIFARLLPKTSLYPAIVLHGANPSQNPIDSLKLTAGMTGQALTQLRPSGTADFGSGPVDVVTAGDFLSPGTKVCVDSVQGNRIVVKSL
jgi:membrane-bound serine protease (ClpP class)